MNYKIAYLIIIVLLAVAIWPWVEPMISKVFRRRRRK